MPIFPIRTQSRAVARRAFRFFIPISCSKPPLHAQPRSDRHRQAIKKPTTKKLYYTSIDLQPRFCGHRLCVPSGCAELRALTVLGGKSRKKRLDFRAGKNRFSRGAISRSRSGAQKFQRGIFLVGAFHGHVQNLGPVRCLVMEVQKSSFCENRGGGLWKRPTAQRVQ